VIPNDESYVVEEVHLGSIKELETIKGLGDPKTAKQLEKGDGLHYRTAIGNIIYA
jgi:hypothetical protein